MKIKRNLLTIFLLGLLLWPVFTLAQDTQGGDGSGGTPTGVQGTDQELKNAAEGIDVKLQIPLPFVKLSPDNKVDNLKDYIEGVYRLLIGVGALFAVVMIIIAGYQYLTSGGSSDKTGAAKKRIWNASIGLVLALTSYVVLNAVSARLVELELPKIEPVKKMLEDSGNACQNNGNIQGPLADINDTPLDYKVERDETACGKKYVDSQSGLNCWGNKCTDPETACVKDECRVVLLSGNISWGGFGSNGYVDSIKVVPICKNMEPSILKAMFGMGRLNMVAYESVARQTAYAFSKTSFAYMYQAGEGGHVPDMSTVTKEQLAQKLEAQCQGRDGVKGFALEVEVNDDSHFFGPTIDDGFVLGRDCSRPFYGQDAATGKKLYNGDDIDWASKTADQLFETADFTGLGKAARCDITVDRSVFPAQ